MKFQPLPTCGCKETDKFFFHTNPLQLFIFPQIINYICIMLIIIILKLYFEYVNINK